MFTREEYQSQESERLVSYAAQAARSGGRKVKETDDPYRTIFQRDRDRIIHSSAFRRLEYKTQVFVNHEGDYYRTRLTHSLEVAQISRAICRTLQLNEDLAEAIALAHDLGHTPFGHAGEEVMNTLMAEHNGYEHNHQSYRVVTRLEERYPNFSGLNLSFEVLEGIVKHSGEYDVPKGIADFSQTGYPSLEAQVVNLADEIAYTHHDLDDGLQSGMLSFDGLSSVPLWSACYAEVEKQLGTVAPKLRKHETIRRLMRTCIHDVLAETERRIADRKIHTLADIRERGEELAAFSPHFAIELKTLKRYLFDHLYRHYRVERMAEKARRVIADLFTAFQKNPRMLPDEYFNRISAHSAREGEAPSGFAGGGGDASPCNTRERIICDYIAGMTDRFAFDEHRKLFDPHAKV